MNRRSVQFFAGLVFGSTLCFATSAAAQQYTVTAGHQPAPQELSAAVRAALSGESLDVVGPTGPLCEIWLRTAIPVAATPSSGLGIAFGQLVDGSLVGAIHFDAPVKDFRNQPISPGTYTLRYALQPVDGNHQGVSDYRDFLLLAPPASDASTANLADNDLYALSRKVSGSGHPSVWSLVPPETPPVTLPAVAHDNNEDLWIVYFRAPIAPASAAASRLTLGLVVAGHAEEQ